MKSKRSLFQLQHMASLAVLGGSCAGVGAQTSQQPVTTYPPVQVVETPLEYRQFEKMEITGSSIIRKEQTLALPVQLITRQEIQRKGLQSVTQVVQSLTQVFNGLDRTQGGKLQGGFTNGALHGMPTGTVVLLNGAGWPRLASRTSPAPKWPMSTWTVCLWRLLTALRS